MPRYVLERRIGDGGMAEVFRAQVEGLAGFRRTCAVKRLLPELRRDRGLQLRFIDEARIAGRLQHPNIVEVTDFYEEDGAQHLVMEFIDGVSAEQLVEGARQGRFVPLPVTAAILLATARALQHAHVNGVLHRDVSACNVLLSRQGEVKLADFGLADAVGRLSSTEPGSIAGKLEYMSSSRRLGRPATPLDDVYALGIVLQRLLAAAHPAQRAKGSGPALLHLQQEMVASSSGPDWDEIIEHLLRAGVANSDEVGEVVSAARLDSSTQ